MRVSRFSRTVLTAALVSSAAATATIAAATQPAHADWPRTTMQIASLDPDHAGRCLNMQSNNTLHTVSCADGVARQQWQQVPVGNAGKLKNVQTGLCADTGTPVEKVVGNRCKDTQALWSYDSGSNRIVTKTGTGAEFCLGAASKVNDPVEVSSCNSTRTSSLKWEVRSVG
ncbi:ricin-type beta-trefoil lectin domain protein [Nocardia sp. NPDC051570]|uniref:ricin-type beta-trefoil lectin domain protein n=1 Tax=Nocardia sp. NPDC051570 TaxID=3364324 RepID=UPI0037AE9E67